MNTEIIEHKSIFDVKPIDIETIKKQLTSIAKIKQEIMQEGRDFGTIPGCGSKPTLLKPGAERLLQFFRLRPMTKVELRDLPDGHREYTATCEILSPDGQIAGNGIGTCTTLESKYRWRKSSLKCPICNQPTIIKNQYGKGEYLNGYVCFKKKDGCGQIFKSDEAKIINQSLGVIENPDIADTYNTVIKIAKKRALVDATLTIVGASDMFTQDIEDFGTSWENTIDITPNVLILATREEKEELLKLLKDINIEKKEASNWIEFYLGKKIDSDNPLTRVDFEKCKKIALDKSLERLEEFHNNIIEEDDKNIFLDKSPF